MRVFGTQLISGMHVHHNACANAYENLYMRYMDLIFVLISISGMRSQLLFKRGLGWWDSLNCKNFAVVPGVPF